MMFEKVVSVTYLSMKDNFIYVPKNFGFLKHGACVKLLYGENESGYFSISNTALILEENCIGISSLYAKALGIEDDETVVLMEVPEFPVINSITITPINHVDYEILESFSDNIQETLLTQIRAVYKHQKFVIWIGNNLNITVFIDDVNPVPVGFLGFLTEVHIKEKMESNMKNNNTVRSLGNSSHNIEAVKALAKLLSRPINSAYNVNKFLNFKKELILRIVPLDSFPYVKNLKGYNKIFNMFTSKKSLKTTWFVENSLKSPVVCSATLIKDDNVFLDRLYGRLIAFEDILDEIDTIYENDVFVSKPVFDKFICQMGAKLKVEYVEKKPLVTEIEVSTKKKYLRNFEHIFKQFMADCSDVVTVLNSDTTLYINSKVMCTLKFNNSLKFVVVDDDLVRNCKYKFSEDSNAISEIKKDEITRKNEYYLLEIGNYSNIINNVSKSFSRGSGCFENTIISGRPGSGKSTMLIEIANKLESYPNLIFTKTLKCKSVKGKTIESLHKLFDGIFSELILHQPSVLLLDDLHILCKNVQGEQQLQSLYFNRISEMLYNFFKVMSLQNNIGICATTDSLESLNTNMYTSRGSYLYKSFYTINDFTKGDRLSLLKFLFKDCDMEDINLEKLSLKTEGFVVHDIVDFYNKTMFEAFKKANDKGIIKIVQDYCNKAFDNTCVLSLENVNLHSPGDKDFSDIGGLQQVKKALLESLLWPAKFPNIFANTPLRLQTGLLLYGPPGTGKTLIAAAAAKHCDLRLISVKGPELLSKYIGASEEAVRNVFQTAQSVKPCMIFFDEFDSLAPRRGNDTTGVSDRVVNQLLTQLDGVESLTGVYVMAATSRPDLLDPALLRPGRLDKQLYCSLPNEGERLDILTILSRNLELTDDVNLKTLASKTEWYTGADLQSLMYTAQVSTVAGIFEDGQVNEEFAKSKVTQQHLEEALAKTKPSLTQQDRVRYQRIYAKFQSGSITEDYEAGTKATFA